jgi:hypothetical protein
MLGLFAVPIIVQGALRKWILPQFATPLYVAKDVALIAALVFFGHRYSFRLTTPLRRSALPLLWGAFGFVVVLQSFNLNSPSVLVSVLGIRSYLLYTTLLLLMPLALEHVERPERLVLVTSAVVLSVLALGAYQYSQPVDSWINQYVADSANVTGVLSHPRITGTFSYIGGMGEFLLFAQFLGLGIVLAGWRYRRRLYQILGGGLFILALVVSPMNGSRSVVLGILIPLPVILFTLLGRRGGSYAVTGLLLILLVGGGFLSQSEWAMRGWETIEYRMEHASDQETRVQTMLLDPIQKVGVGGVVGYGAGTTHQAASVLSDEGRLQIEGVSYEGELGRVIIELGVFGALFFLLVKVWFAWAAWQAMRRATTAWTLLLSVTAFGFLFLKLGVGMIVFNHIAGALYWLCAGSVVWVWSRQEVRRLSNERVKVGG